MPSLDDLHSAFAELERQAPETVTVPIARRRSHRSAVLAAAACTALVAGLGVAAAHRTDDGATPRTSLSAAHTATRQAEDPPFPAALPAPADGQSPVLSYGFVESGVGSVRVTPDLITRMYQHATVTTTTTTPGELFVFYGGAYDPSAAEQGDATTVDGRPGYFAHVALPDGTAQDALVWQYADDGWALVYLQPSGDPGAKGSGSAAQRRGAERRAAQRQAQAAAVRELELQLAQHLRATQLPLPQRSPVRIASGSGLYLQSMSDAANGSIALDRGAASGNDLGTAYTLGWSPSPIRVDDKPNSGVTSIAGNNWVVFHNSMGDVTGLGLVFSTYWGLTVTPAAGSVTDPAALEQFAASLQFASDPSNSDTWFDASTALP